MEIKKRQVGDIHILDCSGKIIMGEAITMLRTAVQDIIAANGKNVILNLAEIGYADSTGLGELVVAYLAVHDAGGQLILLNMAKNIEGMLVITKLRGIFDAYDDEQTAINSFGSTCRE